MKKHKNTNKLESVVIASPCKKNWDEMQGDNRTRFCDSCSKNVYNISDMTTNEAEEFLSRGTACLRVFRRHDGTIMTDDCPVGLRKIRDGARFIARSVACIVGFVVTASVAIAKGPDSFQKTGEDPKNCSGEVTVSPIPPVVTGVTGEMGEFRADHHFEGVVFSGSAEVRKPLTADLLKSIEPKVLSNFEQAAVLQCEEKYNEAIDLYDRSLVDDPKSISAYNNLALCLIYRKLPGDMQRARELLNKADSMGGHNASTFFVSAVWKEASGDYPGAVVDYELLLNRSRNVQAVLRLAELYKKRKDYDKAWDLLDHALRWNFLDEEKALISDAIENFNRQKP